MLLYQGNVKAQKVVQNMERVSEAIKTIQLAENGR